MELGSFLQTVLRRVGPYEGQERHWRRTVAELVNILQSHWLRGRAPDFIGFLDDCKSVCVWHCARRVVDGGRDHVLLFQGRCSHCLAQGQCIQLRRLNIDRASGSEYYDVHMVRQRRR